MRIVKKLCHSDKLHIEFVEDFPSKCQMTRFEHQYESGRDRKVLKKTAESTHTQRNGVMGRKEQQYIPQSPSSLVPPGRDRNVKETQAAHTDAPAQDNNHNHQNHQYYHQNILVLETDTPEHSDFQDSDSDSSYEGKYEG